MRNAISAKLKTEVERIEYDCRTRTGCVFMAASCCVDMTSTLDLFLQLDTKVQAIESFAGEHNNTCYFRATQTAWQVIDHGGRLWPEVIWPRARSIAQPTRKP